MTDLIAWMVTATIIALVSLALWRWAGFPVVAILLLSAIYAELVVRDG